MAARKTKRTGAAKRKAAPSRRSKAKTAKRPAKKTKQSAGKSVKTATKSAATKKKAPARKASKSKGEGDYAASRAFLKDQAGFVEKNKSDIPAMGKEAEKALDGPEGAGLRDAEAAAAARSRDV